MIIRKKNLLDLVIGGTILGGGGGGGYKIGLEFLKSVKDLNIELKSIDELNDDDILVTASLVGAPNAKDKYVDDNNLIEAFEIFIKNYDKKVAGIITNEQGGEASINGVIQSIKLGIPLVDAPCNGRAHPTGVMGSINLHKEEGYESLQAISGGKDKNKVTGFIKGGLQKVSKIVREASIEAGGVVAVARNPVEVSYAKKNCAIGSVQEAMKLGETFNEGLLESKQKALENLKKFFNAEIIKEGKVSEFSIKTEGGFDIGYVKVDDLELTFWNEYMSAEIDSKRLFTFPDLIMTFDRETLEPLTTAMMKKDIDVIVIGVKKKDLILAKTMFDENLLYSLEKVIDKEVVKYL